MTAQYMHKLDPVCLRFALVGGPRDFHVHSLEWAKAAFSIADAVLELERRSKPDAFGFITDVDYRYGPQGPIRTVVRGMTGRWPVYLDHYRGFGPPKRGRWYLTKDFWKRTRPPIPAVYVYSCERVMSNRFEYACRDLSEASSGAGVSSPLVVMPDGGGARPFSDRFESERTSLGALLLAGFDPGPPQVVSVPSLTTVVLESGERVDPAVFHAALHFLKVRHQSSLAVWDVINDPLLRESAVVALPKGGAGS